MGNEQGTKESEELIDWIFDLVDAVNASKADGKITLKDAPNFMKVAFNAPKAIGGINLVPKEFANLDEEELKRIHNKIKSRYDISDDKVEAYIENAILNALSLAKNITGILSLRNA